MKKERFCVLFSLILVLIVLFCSPHYDDTQDDCKNRDNGSVSLEGKVFILNLRSKKFHNEDCFWGSIISEKNASIYDGARKDLIEKGFSPCKRCNP